MTSVLIDFNNLVIRSVFSKDVCQKCPETKVVTDVDWDLWKYRVFQSCYGSLFHVKKAREVVLAVDDRKSWRYEVWSRYKESRKKKRDKDKFDWDEFFARYTALQEEFKKHFPFKILNLERAEADDIIGVITLNTNHQIHIISTDKDFLQLYNANRVRIFNPMKQTEVSHPNPNMFLVQECLIGQAKDDIFNIKTPLDWPEGKRKPGFGPKALDKVIAYGWKDWLKDNDLVERFVFNRQLMDFSKIPEDIKKGVLEQYNSYETPTPDMIYEFFKENQWPEYLENLTNVENKLYEIY